MKKTKKVTKKIVKKPAIKSVVKKFKDYDKKFAKRKYSEPIEIKPVSKPKTPIHGADYWLNRPLNDKHLDWNLAKNWIDDYWQSQSHEHRKLVLKALEELEPWDSLLELGCNCGPNLALISKAFRGKRLLGIDVEPRVIERAKDELREVLFEVGNITKLPWDTQSVDVALADAMLMYLDDEELRLALDEIERVVKKAVVIIDRFSKESVRSGDVRARNYEKLLTDRGFEVKKTKLGKNWPGGVGWAKLGYLFVATK